MWVEMDCYCMCQIFGPVKTHKKDWWHPNPNNYHKEFFSTPCTSFNEIKIFSVILLNSSSSSPLLVWLFCSLGLAFFFILKLENTFLFLCLIKTYKFCDLTFEELMCGHISHLQLILEPPSFEKRIIWSRVSAGPLCPNQTHLVCSCLIYFICSDINIICKHKGLY